MRARAQLLEIQLAHFERLQRYALRLFGEPSPALSAYNREYQKEFETFDAISTKRELVEVLQDAKIGLCGDYHTLSQAQRTVIRLLRDLVPRFRQKNQEVILALEMLSPQDDAAVQAYLKGSLSDEKFLDSIGFSGNWGFSWLNFRKLFSFARQQGVRVVGINGPSHGAELRVRDRFMAGALANLAEANPGSFLFTLVGDHHLASGHLPRDLKTVAPGLDPVVIHQNDDGLYWLLARRELDQKVDVLRLRERVYCVMNAAPWVKLQSQIKWRELQDEIEINSAEEEELVHELDFSEEVLESLAMIQDFLGIDEPVDDDFHLCTSEDAGVMERAMADLGLPERRVLGECLGRFHSHFIPLEKIIYLNIPNLNHVAAQSAIFLHSKVSDFRENFVSPKRDFYAFLWVEALGFLGSKIANPKRKCDGPADLKRQGTPVALLALEHLKLEREGKQPVFPEGPSLGETMRYYLAAKIQGALLGHALYCAVEDQVVSSEQVRGLFENPLRDGWDLYAEWSRRLDEFGYRRIDKRERL